MRGPGRPAGGPPPEVVDLDLAELRAAGPGPAGWGEAAATAFARGARRVQVWAPAGDPQVQVAAQVAGFRLEGRCRFPGGDRWLLARLAGDVDPVTDGLPAIASFFDRVIRASGWLIRDGDGRVLLLETTYKRAWDLPGGIVEPGEDLVSAARREIAEELGLDLPLGRLLVVDHCLDDGRRGDIQLVVFDGGVHPAGFTEQVRFLDGEIRAAHWVPPDGLDEVTVPGTARRLRAGLQVLATGADTVLLHEGRPVPLG